MTHCIKCDNCGRELHRPYVELICREKAPCPDTKYDFCSKNCMDSYLNKHTELFP